MNQDGTPVSPQPPIFSGAAPSGPSNSNVPGYFNKAMGDIVIDDPSAKKKSKKAIALIIAAVILLLVGVGVVMLVMMPKVISPKKVAYSDVAKTVTEDSNAYIKRMEKRVFDYCDEKNTLFSFTSDNTKSILENGIKSLGDTKTVLGDADRIALSDSEIDVASLRDDIKKSYSFFRGVIDRYNSYYKYVTEGNEDDTFASFSESVKNAASLHRKYHIYASASADKRVPLDHATSVQIEAILADKKIAKDILLSDTSIQFKDYAVAEKVTKTIPLNAGENK